MPEGRATEVVTRRERAQELAVFSCILVIGAGLLLFRLGSISWTWDETIDMRIVSCLQRSKDPFSCRGDISQTRLPMYLHAVVAMLTPGRAAHYVLSAFFALGNAVLVFIFTRTHFGTRTALLAMALVATSPAVLASGRMLMSHSNVMLTTFTLVAVVAYDRFDRSGNRGFVWLSAASFGLALASSVLGLFTALVLFPLWLFGSRHRRLWHPLVYGVAAAAVFFASTIIYLRPENLTALARETLNPHTYPEWNYLQLGTSFAPRWFSPLLFAVRIGPWWGALFAVAPLVLLTGSSDRRSRRTSLIIWGAFLALMLLKSGVFRYDAPHQQVPWYPLVAVVVAATVMELIRRFRNYRPVLFGALVVLLGAHVHDTVRFFPNYLFYGAQHGDRFIGEFYGPAVMHKQDRTDTDRHIDDLIAGNPDVRILMADKNVFERNGEHFIRFSDRDPSRDYEFALVDRVYATHLRSPGRDDYNAFLAANYTVVWSHGFPTQKWAYRILQRKPSGSASPTRLHRRSAGV